MQSGMRQRFVDRFVSIGQVDVLADHGHAHGHILTDTGIHECRPVRQIRLGGLDAEVTNDQIIQMLALQQARHLVDIVDVLGRDDRAIVHVGKQRDLAALVLRQRPVGATNQDIGLNTDRAQLFDRVLRGLGLHFLAGGDIRHER